MKQTINVAVVGVSGVEKDKGQIGVGKSCLCNRFVRPLNDCYFIDHISVLSQSDFSGRVVNNDHFLYWGEVRKTSEEGVEYNFSLIEQTEFVDDATFQPFKVGKMEPYSKRCAAQRIYSAEKLMYICKNQLGIEREYEQIVLPDGRMTIDGYVCVFDVSLVPNRPIEKQVDFVSNIIANLLKTKKPIVLVTTKNDEASEAYVREAEKICQRKEYKNSIQLIETSAHESINVDMAFIALAQMVEKAKVKSKIVTYNEAAKVRKELLDSNTEYVTRLIRSQITDYRSIWTSSSKKLAAHKEWQDFLELFGQEAGQRIFRRHLKKLREEHTNKKLQGYMDAFAQTLHDIMPEINLTPLDRDSDWTTVKSYIRNHMDSAQYFFDCGDRATWPELSDLSDMEEENRIPLDVLDTPEAEMVFKNHMSTLQQEQKRLEWKKQFKKLLEETGYVTPGKQLSEVRVLFMGRECFEALSEHDCQQIYDNHQRDLVETAKHNFQELLLEHADLFYHFKSIEPSGTITQNDIKDITDVLQEDFRYKLLDRLDSDRKLILFQHLGFVHCPIREHCPAFPNCIDAMIERILASNNQNIPGGRRYSHHKDGHLQLNLVVIGLDFVANEFIGKIHLNCNDNGEYLIDGQTYVLNIETINRENDSYSFDLQSKGIICVFSNHLSFEYCYETLEKLCLDNIEFKENITNLHLVLMNDIETTAKINLEDSNLTRQDAKQLAEKLHCIFVDDNNFYSMLSPQNQQKFIDNILNSIVETIPFEELKYSITDLPDIRIILCMFCGDPYSVEFILTSLMSEQSCVSAGERNIVLELFLGDTKRRVEIILSSYHGANAFRDELVHGFILLYSTKRKASLASLSAFSLNIPNLPMQIVSVTDQGGVNAFFNNEMCQMLMTDGNALADKLRAHFATSSDEELHFKFASFAPFLREVWEKKPEIEHAFHMEEPLIDSGEGTMEHSISKYHRIPQPPPRFESYLINNNDDRQTYSNMYFYEENNSDGDGVGKDDRLGPRGMNQGFQIYPPPTTPPEPAPPDHLLTPSSMLRQLETNAVSNSQSSLEEINCWLDDNFLLPKHDSNKHNMPQSQQPDDHVYHAFTTGRRPNNTQNSSFTKKPRPKGPSQTLKQPGKLNLKTFAMVNEAISRMNMGDNAASDKERKHSKTEYSETESESSSLERKRTTDGYSKINRKPQGHKRMRKKRGVIPVQPPKIPPLGAYPDGGLGVGVGGLPMMYQKLKNERNINSDKDTLQEDESSVSSPRENSSPIFGMMSKLGSKDLDREKLLTSMSAAGGGTGKPEKQKWLNLDSRKSSIAKDEEKRAKKAAKSNAKAPAATVKKELINFKQSDKNLVPLFLEKCVQFIELEGLDSEGIYRVPGNRAHVDLLYQKFDEEKNVDMEELDIPVNAVATALKDFFSKKLPPLFEADIMNELEEIAGSRQQPSVANTMNMELKNDRSCRLLALRGLLNKLPAVNFAILKFIFQHFVRVSENAKLNSMDSKNLAICWWPTLLPIEFTDMGRFESMRPYLEDIVQTMIDQYPFLFCGKEAFVMV